MLSFTWLLFASLAFLGLPAQSATLNDTGITTCSNATQNGLPCPVAGFPRQDAEYGTNKFNFTKLDAAGIALPVTATAWSCVKDNVTGLIWEVKTDDNGLRDKDWVYTWYNTPNGAPSPSTLLICATAGRCDTEKFAIDVNAQGLCGYNDWRLPNPQELVGIVDYHIPTSGPTIATDYFPNTKNSAFWVNARYGSVYSYLVDFYNGLVSVTYSDRGQSVRLVRGSQSLAAFADEGDGTILDASTGLMWAKCSLGQSGNDCASGSATYNLTWVQALTAAQSSTLGGYSGWRVPNIKELQSLVNYNGGISPTINSTFFPKTPVENKSWSTSSNAYYANSSWVMSNGGTTIFEGRAGCTTGCAVRFVRSGQPPTAVTGSYTFPSANTVALNGTVTPNGADTTVTFDFGLTTTYNENIAAQPGTIAGTATATSVLAGKSNLACTQAYHYRVKAVNKYGTTYGTDRSFIRPCPPLVWTDNPSVITSNSATLGGRVNPNGADTTTVTFDFGPTTAYGESIVATPSTIVATAVVDAGASVSAIKTGLTCGTYYYRVKAVNSAGTTYGGRAQFNITCGTNLRLSISDWQSSVTAGDTLTYIAEVVNDGDIAVNNAVFKAPTVANLNVTAVGCGTLASVCPTTLSVALLQGTGLVIPTLPHNGGMTFSITATVAPSTPDGNLTYTANITPPVGVTDENPANNTATDTNRVTSRPDFVVTAITLTPPVPIAGSAFSVAVTVKNQGDVAGNGGWLDVWANTTTVPVCGAYGDNWIFVGSLAAGASKIITVNNLRGQFPGMNRLLAFVDSGCSATEIDETNNQTAKTYTVGSSSTVDLVITGITISPTIPSPNDAFSAIVTVKNQGTTAITDGGWLDVWANTTTVPVCGVNGDSWANVGTLAAGASKTITVTGLHAQLLGTNRLLAFVDSGCSVTEMNETNNQLTKAYSTIVTMQSCMAIKTANPSAPSGTYLIDPDGTGAGVAFQAYCNMTTDGGGWTRIFLAPSSNLNYTVQEGGSYTEPNTTLRNGATEALIGYVDASGVTLLTNYARFAMPNEWKVQAPFGYDKIDVSTSVYVNGGAGVIRTLRFGKSSFSNLCSDPWYTDGHIWGRVCVTNTNAPFYSGFAISNVDTCSESNQGWNATSCTSSRQFSIWVRSTVDLVITAITISPTIPIPNGTFSATVTVKNQGTAATTNGGYLDVWANTTIVRSCGAVGNARANVGILAAGASKTITVSGLSGQLLGQNRLLAFVDSGCSVAEMNETNNQLAKMYSASW